MINTYLVRGTAAFMGSHSVDQFLNMGHRMIGVDNLRARHLNNLEQALTSPNLQFLQIKVTNEKILITVFSRYRFTRVLHLAALVSVPKIFKKPAFNFRTNMTLLPTLFAKWLSKLIANHTTKKSCHSNLHTCRKAFYHPFKERLHP